MTVDLQYDWNYVTTVIVNDAARHVWSTDHPEGFEAFTLTFAKGTPGAEDRPKACCGLWTSKAALQQQCGISW